MATAGRAPDKQTIEGIREHLTHDTLPNLIAKTRARPNGGQYRGFEVLNEMDLIEADLEELRAMESERSRCPNAALGARPTPSATTRRLSRGEETQRD